MNKNILYFTRTMGLGGTEKVVVQLCKLMNKDNKVIVCSCGGVNIGLLNSMGIKHYTIPDIENKSLINVVKTIKILMKIIKNENIDIIHTHHRMAAFYTRVLTFFKDFYFINTAHNIFTDKKQLTRFAYKNATIVAVGDHVKKNLIEFYNLPKENVNVIYNAVESLNMPIRTIECINKWKSENKFIIGNIGRLSEQKGMIYFLKAAKILLKKYSNLKFIIVGEGELRGELEAYIKKNSLYDSIILLGYREDVQNIMAQIDLVVLSSLWEGFPLTPIEAFSVGKTVIATNIEGTIEIVKDKENGLLVEVCNEIDLSDKIEFLLKNNNELDKYNKAAQETYNNNYDMNKFNNSHVQLYTRR